jgi:hypothetical protein
MLDIRGWDQDSLFPGQASLFADIEETFNFFIYSTDGLDLTVLIDRSGNSQ